MLRKERERSDDAFLQDVLNRAEVVTIAFSDEDGPYVIPVNFVHTHGGICFHCALKGHKLDCMAREPRVGFSVYCDVAIDRKLATTRYSSISGSGNAEMVVDVAEKQEILELLARKFESQCTLPVPASTAEKTGVVRIRIKHWCGKFNPHSNKV